MNYSNNIIPDLEGSFNNYSFNLVIIEYGGEIPIFFIQPKEASSLEDDWENITTFIACNYQVNLKSEYETWNIYLFFLVDKPISNDIKYKIENDTFSSRKIVIESETDYNKIIEDHIINKNLSIDKIKTINQNEKIFTKNKIISKALLNEEVRGKKNIKTDIADRVLKKLYQNFKRDSNEI